MSQPKVEEDLLPSILAETVPEVAKRVLSSTREPMTSLSQIGGQEVILTSDPKFAQHVFEKNGKNYVQRMANNDGLSKLGMLNTGLIWNNDDTWKSIRKVFDKCLNNSVLQSAEEVARHEVLRLVEEAVEAAQVTGEVGIQMLDIMRKVTFRVTMSVFFGVNAEGFPKIDLNEEVVIASIVDYFKAWEYHLFRPQEAQYHTELDSGKHSEAVQALWYQVGKIVDGMKQIREGAIPGVRALEAGSKKKIFVDILLDQLDDSQVPDMTEEMLQQTVLEMLLAGTDTSSVTAYYCILGLAEKQCSDFQEKLHSGLRVGCGGQLLDGLLNETLRFKPVGPIIIRQAVADDEYKEMLIKAGTGVIIHVAQMNILECFWDDPTEFLPERTDFEKNNSKENPCFYPFGKGPKACVGQHLGMKEVKAILEELVKKYRFACAEEDSPLKTLATRWDIANQPSDPLKVECICR